MTFISKLIGTFLGVGFFPVAPGTAATAVGVGITFLLAGNFFWYTFWLVVFTGLGILASGKLEKVLNEKDPGIVVIDEVVGVMIALANLPLTPSVLISGFFLFRAFDMFKIYPINKIEHLPGGFGIMLDDVMAGVYTNIVLQIAVRVAGII